MLFGLQERVKTAKKALNRLKTGVLAILGRKLAI